MDPEDMKMLDDLFQNRKLMINLISEIAHELDEVHKNVRITKVVTGSTGIAGTILCITGFILAIPTAGASLALSVGGSILAVTSGAAHLGSDIAEHVITQDRLKQLREFCETDEANVVKLQNHLEKCNEMLKKTDTPGVVIGTTASTVGEITNISNLICSVVRVSQAATLTVNAVRIIGTTTAILNVVALPVQIIDLAMNSHALHEKQVSETSVKLRVLVKELQTQMDNIKKFLENPILPTNVQ